MIYKKKNLGGSTGKVYEYLFDEIIQNRIKPGGAISEADIAARLKSSRTPVRDAMLVLESEGLITRYPSRGCFVSPVTVQDVEEIFELRTLLEVSALRRALPLIPDELLENLETRLLALSPEKAAEAYYETDRELHSLILGYCGNGRLLDFLGILNAQIERVRVISAKKPDRLLHSRQEHLELVAALRRRDLPQAEALLIAHIGNVRNNAIEVCKYMDIADQTFARSGASSSAP